MKTLKILITILLLSITAFPCGAPQSVFGRITQRSTSIVILEQTDGPEIRIAFTSPFGYFKFYEVTPCQEYKVTVISKSASYPSPVFVLPGDSPVEINLEPNG